MSDKKLSFTDRAWEDYIYWQTQDKKSLKKVNTLLKDIKRHPFEGIGKPEPLIGNNYAGYWSRRIDNQNRLVYKVTDTIDIDQCKTHYNDK